ncbi:hypothetical protein CMUS01_02891 [Colletotrichum musicola]|uniref:Uncharacterized protein n=1 Tax=Colletotrichum musicola TaxID=2175873 RepID=A0A8H6U7D6_9PEZI|nr:hypothetical protein CMUS01_02891 [Colletotrichum musicola]
MLHGATSRLCSALPLKKYGQCYKALPSDCFSSTVALLRLRAACCAS